METIPFPDSLDDDHANDDYAEEHATNNDSFTKQERKLSGGILSKLSFLGSGADENQTLADKTQLSPVFAHGDDRALPKSTSRAMAVVIQQQKTRRRKGSLRKAALLGRGAQRDKKEVRTASLDGSHRGYGMDGTLESTSPEDPVPAGFGLGISDATPRPSVDGRPGRAGSIPSSITTLPMGSDYQIFTSPAQATSPTLTYTSTTDEEDILSIPIHNSASLRSGSQTSSGGSGPYFPPGYFTRHRSFQKPKSPLSIGGLASSPMPVPDGEWDYSETEWWGWVVLIVTWIVFVTGMGSCLGVWSWAWDVGETPYAPPELEDDPTLPIVGYYPALMILTAVMAWVWVVVAWVGMKYFRHAKISGD